MRTNNRNIFILFFASIITSAIAKDFPDIKELMTEKEFNSANLHKLTDQEISALNKWLVKYTTQDVPELIREVPELKKSMQLQKSLADELESFDTKIKGDFKGWKGKTIFKLENGQIWKQRYSGRYYKKLKNPEVRFSKNAMGFYVMEVLETGKKIGVKKLR